MKTKIFVIACVFSLFSEMASASDLFSPTLGINTWSGDTTLKGFKNNNQERFVNHSKKEMIAYEKKNNIKLFSVVGDNTRYGKTAFYVQAPSEGCYNRQLHDCNRRNGASQKRVEANYSSFKGGEHWFTVSLKLDNWDMGRYGAIVTQFHSDVPQYQPMMITRINKKYGLYIEHLSANGFQYVEGGSEECGGGAADKKTKDKTWCPTEYDVYQLVPSSDLQKNKWYDFIYHVNFDKENPEQEFLKVYLNGKLVVNTKGTGKILWWPTMPGVEEWENKVKFQFGIYSTRKDNSYHSAYFDEVGKSYTCEKLKIDRLGYTCESLKNQSKVTKPDWHDSPDI